MDREIVRLANSIARLRELKKELSKKDSALDYILVVEEIARLKTKLGGVGCEYKKGKKHNCKAGHGMRKPVRTRNKR